MVGLHCKKTNSVLSVKYVCTYAYATTETTLFKFMSNYRIVTYRLLQNSGLRQILNAEFRIKTKGFKKGTSSLWHLSAKRSTWVNFSPAG